MTRQASIGLALIAASILLGIAIHFGLTMPFDVALMRRVALVHGRSSEALISTARAISSFGLPGVRTALVIMVLIVMLVRHHPRSAMIYAVTVIGSITAYTALKIAFARARPALTPWLDHPQNLSYPSGHAAGSMVVLLLPALLLAPSSPGSRRLPVVAIAVSMAIGITRPMLGVHWPTDVLGGWLFGAGSALIGAALVRRRAL